MKMFSEFILSEFFRNRNLKLEDEIQKMDRNELLNINETEFINYLARKYRIEPINIAFDDKTISDDEIDIDTRHYRDDFDERSRLSQIVTIHIPFSGEADLLRSQPSQFIVWTIDFSIMEKSICIPVVAEGQSGDELARDIEHIIAHIKTNASHIQQDIETFNSQVEKVAQSAFQQRKATLLKQLDRLKATGIPVRRKTDVPATFSIPMEKKPVVPKPRASVRDYSPEPTLSDEVYSAILKLVHDWGIEMERHPAIYEGKDEPTLRDVFLLLLSPHFDSTTGETFNKNGKTDILIRHEKKNTFVAECKFWSGISNFYKTIDQILSYLTWRDSKSAIICFIDNKDIQPVLTQIETETAKHSCFVKYHGRKENSWFDFEFHLKDDSSRGVKLAILCFHFPKL